MSHPKKIRRNKTIIRKSYLESLSIEAFIKTKTVQWIMAEVMPRPLQSTEEEKVNYILLLLQTAEGCSLWLQTRVDV